MISHAHHIIVIAVPYMDIGMAMDRIIDFMVEAANSLAEVSFALQHGELSQTLPSDSTVAYVNLTTRENRQFCVKLDKSGFQVKMAPSSLIVVKLASFLNPR